MTQSRTESIYRRITDLGYDANLLMGGFFLLTGLMLLAQLYYTSRRGYVVGYGSTRYYQSNEPRSYRIRVAFQAILGGLFVVGGVLFAASEFGF